MKIRRPVSEEVKRERRNAVKNFFKSLIGPVIFLAVVVGALCFIISITGEKESVEIVKVNAYDGDKEPIVLESNNLIFTMDPLTTQFNIQVKSSGKVWYSNHPESVNDSLTKTQEEKNKLQSTMQIVYSMDTGSKLALDNYNYSIENGIYQIETGSDYVKIDYSIGKVQKEFTIPPVIRLSDFEALTDNMSKESKNLAQSYYKKYDINKLGKKDNKEELLENYPVIAEEVILVLRDGVTDNLKSTLQKAFADAGYTYEEYLADKELDMSAQVNDNPVYNISMIYRLEGDDLVVEIPFDSFDYKEEYPLYTITPLPYFGMANKNDGGYMLVPEGGGSLIYNNNGRTAQNNYSANVYGWDMDLSRKAVVHNTRAYYGLFGASDGENSFICMLEDGSSYASVQADISGKTNDMNYVNAIYSINVREQYDVGQIANSDIFVYVDHLDPNEKLVQRYRFVDSGDYTDMAKSYGEYLRNEYPGRFALNTDTEAPVSLEIVGAIDKVKQILGVPVSRPLALTTYEEAEQMISGLKNEGFNNLSVKLIGWCNGGVKQKLMKSTRLINALGNKKSLNSLSSTAESLGVDLYLNAITQYEYNSNIFNGFISFRDAARLISRERNELSDYSHITYSKRDDTNTHYLLNTQLATQMIRNASQSASKYNAGISFEDLGIDLSADYDRRNLHSREEVKNIQIEELQKIADSGQKIAIRMGNDFAVPYADLITDVDLRGSEYTIIDECVPFFQLAVHGYVNYTGECINICGNSEDMLLNSAMYGAGLSFSLMDETAFTLQKTIYTQYYGSEYSAWHDRIVEMYTRYNKELGHTFNQEMTGHKNLSDTLSVTTYADGTRVYVNFSYYDAEADGITIPARDYKVVR